MTFPACLEEPINDSDIGIFHEVPTQNAIEKKILFRFGQRSKGNRVLAINKNTEGWTDDTLLELNDPARIYVNEQLARQSKQLLWCRRRVIASFL